MVKTKNKPTKIKKTSTKKKIEVAFPLLLPKGTVVDFKGTGAEVQETTLILTECAYDEFAVRSFIGGFSKHWKWRSGGNCCSIVRYPKGYVPAPEGSIIGCKSGKWYAQVAFMSRAPVPKFLPGDLIQRKEDTKWIPTTELKRGENLYGYLLRRQIWPLVAKKEKVDLVTVPPTPPAPVYTSADEVPIPEGWTRMQWGRYVYAARVGDDKWVPQQWDEYWSTIYQAWSNSTAFAHGEPSTPNLPYRRLLWRNPNGLLDGSRDFTRDDVPLFNKSKQKELLITNVMTKTDLPVQIIPPSQEVVIAAPAEPLKPPEDKGAKYKKELQRRINDLNLHLNDLAFDWKILQKKQDILREQKEAMEQIIKTIEG